MAGRLEGKVAFISGVARGQGRSHAIALAAEGADIVGFDICSPIDSVPYPTATKEDLESTAAAIEATGRRAILTPGDVRDPAAVREIFEQGIGELGRIDVVVANAGIASSCSSPEMTPEMWSTMIDINLSGVFFTIQPTIEPMIAGGDGGSIIITSSTLGLRAVPNMAHYVSAKHGLTGMTRSLALELAPHGIRVNSVNPTNVDTPMIQNSSVRRLFVPDIEEPTREEAEPYYAAINAIQVPWVQPQDVTDAVLYLATDASKYVTGQALAVDAGFAIL